MTDPATIARAPEAITLSLPYPVSANRYWRPVPVGKTRLAMVPTREAKAYRDGVAWRARAAGLCSPLQGRASIVVRLYPERPQDWAKRSARDPDGWDDTVRCIDLGNCEKVLCDALNGIAWEDDKQLHRIVLERCEPDAHGARVVVEIRPLVRERVAPVVPAIPRCCPIPFGSGRGWTDTTPNPNPIIFSSASSQVAH